MLRKGCRMNKYLAYYLLRNRDTFKVPLKYVDPKQEKDGAYGKAYIPVRERDENNNFIKRKMTIDEEKYSELRAENDHIMNYIMMKNIISIRNCVVFFTILSVVSLLVGFLIVFIAAIN